MGHLPCFEFKDKGHSHVKVRCLACSVVVDIRGLACQMILEAQLAKCSKRQLPPNFGRRMTITTPRKLCVRVCIKWGGGCSKIFHMQFIGSLKIVYLINTAGDDYDRYCHHSPVSAHHGFSWLILPSFPCISSSWVFVCAPNTKMITRTDYGTHLKFMVTMIYNKSPFLT